MQNAGRRVGYEARFLLNPVVSLKRVIMHEMRDEVADAVAELSGSEAGQGNYMAYYQQGVEQVTQSLSSERLVEMEGIRQQWMNRQYPSEVRRK
jgi:hypothetical protein